ncbi:hypothetical protein [Martelella soudanensis]|uniref:hypothetical protein n=1 Tax=unclassified Martelella TaxID=2629616 RepID=UPI0015DF6155|nr:MULTISPECIES: hypothetical protein [unclassified Martelella]
MKSIQKPPLRSRGFIGGKPASSVTADTGPLKMTGPGKSRGAVKPNPTGAPKGLEQNIPPRPKWRIK